MKLPFFKLDGAGNDFVGLDWRGKPAASDGELGRMARLLCDRYHGVGADGILVLGDVAPSEGVHFSMRYLNSDGSVGEMCGNGARCIARFAHLLGAAPSTMRFLTGAGVYRAEILERDVRIHVPEVTQLPARISMTGPLRPFPEVQLLVVGVPHAVVFTEDLDLLDVFSSGKAIRHDPALAPRGANVNFAEQAGEMVRVRTYERGVEAETQACGTGSVAAACCSATARGLSGPVEITVIPTSGIPLQIGLTRTESGYKNITLAGPANVTFQGECDLDILGKQRNTT
jgi:diaminopimelate epimerase